MEAVRVRNVLIFKIMIFILQERFLHMYGVTLNEVRCKLN